MYFSVVVPTFSRTEEVSELLLSLEDQLYKDFEVIIADGSLDDSVGQVVMNFRNRLELKYLYHKGLGISESRNWGVENAGGEYVVFFDSDCVVPPGYFKYVLDALHLNPLDAYGGPDRAGEHFNSRQKAISYAMTSIFTTGGIRGRKKHAGPYQPRSFNMGIRKSVFNELGGFSSLKVSEDIDLSMRLVKNGYRTGLLEEAFVYHKRRSTFYRFFCQVFSFGSGRIDLQRRHGNALKLVHLLPSLFVLYMALGIFLAVFPGEILLLWATTTGIYCFAIFVDASLQNRNPAIGFLSIYASFIMLTGYGLGMIKAMWMRFVIKSTRESQKPDITKGS